MHIPVAQDVADALGNPACAFVTGGPREYLPGINCIGRRLDALGSKHPLLVMVEPEDEAYMRRHVVVNQHKSSAVVPWKRFPTHTNVSSSWRYRSAHVMDKMNIFGMPFRRLVWIDADVFVRRNVDELCSLPESVSFASWLDAEGTPTHCIGSTGHRIRCPSTCKHYNLKGDGRPYVSLSVAEMQPPPSECPYVIQSGVMMLQPLNISAFNEMIVRPVSSGATNSYDSGDQGMIGTLLYKSRLFGDAYHRLHPLYNVIARHAKHTEHHWGIGSKEYPPGKLTAALLHFTRETRPWQGRPGSMTDNGTRAAEWSQKCGDSLCDLLSKQQRAPRARGTSATYKPPISNVVNRLWYPHCGLRVPNMTNSSSSLGSHHGHDFHAHADPMTRAGTTEEQGEETPREVDERAPTTGAQHQYANKFHKFAVAGVELQTIS